MSSPALCTTPWALCPPALLRPVRGVLTDIDDTLTRDGAIEPAALQALHRAQRHGLMQVAVTGRPMGWSLPFARDWPLDGIVAENGAVWLRRSATSPQGVEIAYAQDEPTRQLNALRLRQCAQRILRELPHARLATDSDGRVTDIAVDHSEYAHLPAHDIQRVVDLMQAEGLTATVSSIHINGWIGAHDKWSGAQWALRSLTGRELSAEVAQWIYVGDSTNDQAMFARFGLSVGVANLRDFAAQLHTWPAFLTEGERGEGFAQVIGAVLQAQGVR
jgi:HAD superfamily hydrolase (TIGR01484 family)